MINGELVIEWKKEKSIQCEDFDEDTGEKEYTMLWKQKQKSEFIKENIDETIFMFALFKCGKSDKGRN